MILPLYFSIGCTDDHQAIGSKQNLGSIAAILDTDSIILAAAISTLVYADGKIAIPRPAKLDTRYSVAAMYVIADTSGSTSIPCQAADLCTS